MDLLLLQLINRYAEDYLWLDVFGKFFATDAIIIIAVLVLSLWFIGSDVERKKNQYAVVMAIEAFVLARGIITPIIRELFPRIRPFVEGHATLLIQQSPLETGFPSGHAVMAFALAIPVFLYNRRSGGWLLFLASVISVSRVFVGVHYPTDIVAGFFLALIVVLLINFFRYRLVAPVVKILRRE